MISVPQRLKPNKRVLDWLDAQALETLYLSAVTVAALRAGVALMPAGKRQDGVRAYLEEHLLPLFANRMLDFDVACTRAYAELLARSRAAGATVQTADAFIAAIALANGFAVATRDTTPFEVAGLKVIDPWQG